MEQESSRSRFFNQRNLAAFWLLGLCNNYAYVVMLSAAHDILSDDKNNSTSGENRTGKLVPECNEIGTGAVLLADVLPALIVKLTAPFYMHLVPYNTRVAFVLLLGAASLIVVAFSAAVWVSLMGVVFASIGSGLGEITFLSMSSHFHRNVVSTWSSGTGAAGVFGALSYAGLTAVGVSPRNTLLIMLIIVLIMTFSYYCLLVRPTSLNYWCRSGDRSERRQLLHDSDTEQEDISSTSVQKDEREGSKEAATESTMGYSLGDAVSGFLNRLRLIVPLLKYMIPLGLVYFAEYFINQGIVELIYYEHIWLPIVQQYRWYQVIYQIGVFISRSSVNLVRVKHTWILAILQFCNVAILLCQVFLKYIPNIWIVFALILFEGLLGGCAYVNTFFSITKEVPSQHREYSLGVASVADSFGIAIAGLVSVPVHNWICTL